MWMSTESSLAVCCLTSLLIRQMLPDKINNFSPFLSLIVMHTNISDLCSMSHSREGMS